MRLLSQLEDLEQFNSSYLILATLTGLGLAAGGLFYVGLLGWFIEMVGIVVRGAVRKGFLFWEAFLSWVEWPVFLAIVLGMLIIGGLGGEKFPPLAVVCGTVPLFMGIAACLAYMFIDVERYEVERGYKAVHNPMKGQELAQYLVSYGHQLGVPLLASAAVATIGGFALLNLGLYRGVGKGWYQLAQAQAGYSDFLAYALINLYSLVDLLDLANSQHFLRLSHVRQAAWPASTLLVMFKSFFTLVLLQQIFASVRKGKLLGEMIADFWSPHEPIHERARMALPQYGPMAIGPLLVSLRSVASLTKEQRNQLPLILTTTGPSTIPVLVRHLRDPHEHVRAVAVAALGHLRAHDTVQMLASFVQDSSDAVRLSVVEALGMIGGPGVPPVRKRRRLYSSGQGLRRFWRWRKRVSLGPPPDPVRLAVATLQIALGDESAAVRTQTAVALSRIGLPAASVGQALTALLKDKDETVRCQAAEALGCIGCTTELAITALIDSLQDSSAAVKAAAARALGALKNAAAGAVPALVSLFHDRDKEVREAAANAIAQTGPLNDQAMDAIIQGLESADNVVQAQTAKALGTIGMPAQNAAPALVEALGNRSDRVRANAAEALGKIGDVAAEVAVPSLVRALRDKDNWVSALAAEALGEMGESADEAVPALIRALGHGTPLVRGNAAEALGKMGSAAAGARLALENATRDEDGAVRSQVVRALGMVTGPTTTTKQAVLARFQDTDPQVRAAAVEAIAQWADPSTAVLNGLMTLLEDANDQVKVQVIQVLPKLAEASPAVINGLCRRLGPEDSAWVQMNAAMALGKLGPAAASVGEALLHAAQTGEECVREQAMRAIAKIQPPQMIEAFTTGLKDANAEIRKVASGGWIKAAAIPEEAIPTLIEVLHDPEAQVRVNAARVLARLDTLPPEAIAPLIACTTETNELLRLNAAMALQAAPAGAVSNAMRLMLDDPNMRVRLAAAGALLQLQPNDADASAVLVQALGDVTPQVRRAAQELATSLGDGFLLPFAETQPEGEESALSANTQTVAGLVDSLALPVRQ